MSNTNQSVEDFYAQLSNKQPIQRASDGENSDYIQKLTMSSQKNQGKITYIPFRGKEGFYVMFNNNDHADERVKEVAIFNDEKGYDEWRKVLPIEYYGELTPEQTSLYNEVVSKFKYCLDHEIVDNEWLRYRAYGLIYGFVLSHYNTSQENLIGPEGTKQGPSLLVLPSATVSKKLKDSIDTITSGNAGDKSWIAAAYNNNPTERQGYVTLSFAKSSSSFGYEVSFDHGFNSGVIKVIPEGFTLSDEDAKKFTSILADFLGKDNGKGGSLFNEEMFKELRTHLNGIISGASAAPEDTLGTDVQTNAPAATPVDTMVTPTATVPDPNFSVPPQSTSVPDPVPTQTGQIDPLAGLNTPPPKNS